MRRATLVGDAARRLLDDQPLMRSTLMLTDRGFTDDLLDARVLPCQALLPVIDHVTRRYVGLLQVGTLEAGAGARSTESSTLLLFRSGRVVARLDDPSSNAIAELIDRHLAPG